MEGIRAALACQRVCALAPRRGGFARLAAATNRGSRPCIICPAITYERVWAACRCVVVARRRAHSLSVARALHSVSFSSATYK